MAELILSLLSSLNFFKLLFHLRQQFLLIISSLIFHPPSISGQEFWSMLIKQGHKRNKKSIIFSSAFFTGNFKEMINLQVFLTFPPFPTGLAEYEVNVMTNTLFYFSGLTAIRKIPFSYFSELKGIF